MLQRALMISVGGGSDSFQFSIEEQKTNLKWIDGKPIYIKTFMGSKSGSSILTIGTVPSDSDTIISIEPHENNSDGTSIGQYFTNASDRMRCYINANKSISFDSSNTNTKYIVHIFYTKKTD